MSGDPPYVPAIAADVTSGQKFSASRRIILEVDLAVSPEELARAYRKYRSRQIAPARTRSMSQKNVRLAAFAADKGTQSWATLLRAWNQQWPEHAYELDNVKNFARDARSARRTLLNTPTLRKLRESTNG